VMVTHDQVAVSVALLIFRQASGIPRYRCTRCDYDLCDKCVDASISSDLVPFNIVDSVQDSIQSAGEQFQSSLRLIASAFPSGRRFAMKDFESGFYIRDMLPKFETALGYLNRCDQLLDRAQSSANTKLSTLIEKQHESQRALSDAEDDLRTATRDISTLEDDVKKLKDEVDDSERECSRAKDKIAECERDLAAAKKKTKR